MPDRPRRRPSLPWIRVLPLLIATVSIVGGCTLAPRKFGQVDDPAPIVRARALTLGDSVAQNEAIPVLIQSLDDADPVVRMTANEELKRRTDQDFGFVPWAEPSQRSLALQRWRSWWYGPPKSSRSANPQPTPQQPSPAPESLPADVEAGPVAGGPER